MDSVAVLALTTAWGVQRGRLVRPRGCCVWLAGLLGLWLTTVWGVCSQSLPSTALDRNLLDHMEIYHKSVKVLWVTDAATGYTHGVANTTDGSSDIVWIQQSAGACTAEFNYDMETDTRTPIPGMSCIPGGSIDRRLEPWYTSAATTGKVSIITPYYDPIQDVTVVTISSNITADDGTRIAPSHSAHATNEPPL